MISTRTAPAFLLVLGSLLLGWTGAREEFLGDGTATTREGLVKTRQGT